MSVALITSYLPLFLKGMLSTIWCSAFAGLIGILGGILLALGLLSRSRILSTSVRIYVEIMRGMPALLVLFMLYFGGPSIGLSLEPMVAGIVGLGLYSAAYFAEIFRGGFLSIPTGQTEAADMLGYSKWRTVWEIELPQISALVIPPSVNLLIALVKDSALLSMLTVAELTKAATLMANQTFMFVEPFLMVALLYWIINSLIAHVGSWLENKSRAYL